MNDMSDDQLSRLFGSLERNDAPSDAFADALFERLAGTAPAARRTRLPWLLLAAALMLAAVAGGVAVGSGLVNLPGLSREPLPVPTSSASPSATAGASPTAAPSEVAPSASPTVGPTPTPRTPAGIAVDGLVSTAVDGLKIRTAPGTTEPTLGTLPKDSISYVVDGPRQAAGYDWYLLSGLGLPPATGCATDDSATDPYLCPIWFGWVAAGGGASDPWLSPAALECPDLEPGWSLAATQRLVPLACFGSRTLTLRGFWPTIPPDAALGGMCPDAVGSDLQWIGCNPGYDHLVSGPDHAFFESPTLVMAVPPGLGMPQRGQWLEVTGHYDDAAAEACTFGARPEQSVLHCRSEFVVKTATVVDGPS